MIVTLTPNPSLDRTIELAGPLGRGDVQRAVDAHQEPGGKGVNICRALTASGIESLAILPGDATDPLADTPDAAEPDRFARQVRALGQAGDVLLAISASSTSASVLAAVSAAHERDMTVVALLGNATGHAGTIGRALRETDVQVSVPHDRAARVHEVHLLALHCLCDGVDAQLLGEQEAST